jgi:hypothetical protein
MVGQKLLGLRAAYVRASAYLHGLSEGYAGRSALPSPGTLKKGPQVEPIIVGRVVFGMVRGRERGHLVPVDGVVEEEVLHLLCHLRGAEFAVNGGN